MRKSKSASNSKPPPSKRAKKGEAAAEMKVLNASESQDAEGVAATQRSGRPVIVFAHGAGAGSQSPWMRSWKALLEKTVDAVAVISFDYPYLAGEKKKATPRAETLCGFHREQIKQAMSEHPGHPIVLAGKSMGSRVSCMLAAKVEEAPDAVVCLGYPLKGINGKLRDETLLQVKCPIIFVQGTKDSMCPLPLLENVREKMSVKNEVHIVDGGDHSLTVTKTALKQRGSSQEEENKQAAEAVARFLRESLLPGVGD